jgi:anti-sigma B factor antagonist
MLYSTRIADYGLDGRTHVIEIEGQIDLHAAPSMQERLDAVLEQGTTQVIVDISSVSYIDSTGLTVLVGALKRLRRSGGALSIVVTDYDIERMFESTGLDGMFSLYRSRDEALEDLGGKQ